MTVFDWQTIARNAFVAYGHAVNWKTVEGKDIPQEFDNLPDKVQHGWRAAVYRVAEDVAATVVDASHQGKQ